MSQTTERAIAAALKKLLQQKTLNKITISDLANECGINRMTFYYHFKDIYDLIEWMTNERAEKALEGNKNIGSWQQGLQNLLDALLEEKTFVMGVYHSLSREQIETYLYNVVGDLIWKVIEDYTGGRSVSIDDRRFLTELYKYGISGIILNWISNGMKQPPEIIVEKFDKMGSSILEASVFSFEQK